MTTISTNYKDKWQIKDHPNYIITSCGKVINKQRGKIIKRVVKGYSIGYYIDGTFITLANLRKEAIKIENCPF